LGSKSRAVIVKKALFFAIFRLKLSTPQSYVPIYAGRIAVIVKIICYPMTMDSTTSVNFCHSQIIPLKSGALVIPS
jgi:hypothetical protein